MKKTIQRIEIPFTRSIQIIRGCSEEAAFSISTQGVRIHELVAVAVNCPARSLCRGRDSNPHGTFAPEDFKALTPLVTVLPNHSPPTQSKPFSTVRSPS